MKRRSFVKGSTTALTAIGLTAVPYVEASNNKIKQKSGLSVSINEQSVSFYANLVKESVKVVLISDTHLFMDDERGIPFRTFSERMAKAYNQTTHFQTGKKTTPKESFEKTLAFAKEGNADVIALIGDIFSFPSELAIEWVRSKLDNTGIPYIYVAGNHDWHYEGMKGSLESLRKTWTEKRLKPLYQGKHPLMSVHDIKGIRFIAIDNSTYQISDEQLTFYSNQISTILPIVLLVHIPMYAPGKKISFGCGNPDWGAATDRNFKLERRPKWPKSGHSQTTFDFYKIVFDTPNLMGIFAGHIHQKSIEIIKGIPQIVSDDNASGAFLDVNFSPTQKKYRKLL